jgi:cytochrome oxidase Cu insertion factor (SCO1/SenC/PrrC family)
MKRLMILCFIALFTISLFGFSVDDMKYTLGGKVSSLTLKDLDGKEFDLEKTLKGKDVKGVAFVFISYKCPASIARDSRYIQYAEKLQKNGVLFIGIDANMRTENAKDMKAYAKKMKYNFPILWDEGNVIADRFDAKTTPHAFFVDKKGVLCYKGRIDVNGSNNDIAKEATLANIVGEYVAGKDLSFTETKPDG